MSDVEDVLRTLKARIETLQTEHTRAQAKAELAQEALDAGMKELAEEFGLESVEQAKAMIEELRALAKVQLDTLLGEVAELEEAGWDKN